MPKNLYLRLAIANVKRSREVYVPYFIAATIMSCVYFLILSLIFSTSIKNVPGGETARSVFMAGTVVFTAFAFGFMLYINAFLTKRRKKEFGLYSVLGMNRRHVARVLRWEMLIIVGLGLIFGMLLGMVFGRLVFLLLLRAMRATVEGSTFQMPFIAFIGTIALFAAVMIGNNLYNGLRVRIVNVVDLLQSDKRGEKDSKLVIPAAILGLLLLGGTYAFVLINDDPYFALGVFFPAAFVVIIATFLLFYSGSIALLRLLRNNKNFYYKSGNFVAISGMFHRMRVNARGLASICVFCTMLLVTVAGASSLYFGQEQIARTNNPYDAYVAFTYDHDEELDELENQKRLDNTVHELVAQLDALALAHNVQLQGKLDDRVQPSRGYLQPGKVTYAPDDAPIQYVNSVLLGNSLYMDVMGKAADAEAFCKEIENIPNVIWTNSIYEARQDGYGAYGGLLFLAAFFAILFLVMMVMMIYFKQITEGSEDKERFAIMQKVGMRSEDVKSVVNKQILWVFFLPLGLAVCHILAASKIMMQMISQFGMFDYSITLMCIGLTSIVFAAIYLIVYKQTARVYYRIVKW
ncbi:FtsX-like permease family protein [Eubacteriales bacterium OttesenSCG-928-K08]|nr:FtsX-like permease family protein [Eubacteriales bacterium OttesenSCG-928-K08]